MTQPLMEWESRIGRRVRLRDLYILATVVQTGSMAKAASRLAMSQPSVSEAIANLETALRVRLLDRSPRGTEPTIYAQALLKRGRVVFDELRQGVRDIEGLTNPGAGEVRVGCPETLAGVIAAAVEQVAARYPRVVVHVLPVEPLMTEMRDLRQRNVDLLLGRALQPLVDDEIDAEILFEDSIVVAAGAHSRWARHRKLALSDLIGEPWLLPPESNLLSGPVARAFKAQGLEIPRHHVTTVSMQIRDHLLTTGRFIGVLPASALKQSAGRWKALPIDLGLPPTPVAILTLRDRTLSPVVRLFVDHVRSVAKTMFTPPADNARRGRRSSGAEFGRARPRLKGAPA